MWCSICNLLCLATAIAFANTYGWMMGDVAVNRANLQLVANQTGVVLPENPETTITMNLFTLTTTGLIGVIFFVSAYWSLVAGRAVVRELLGIGDLE